MVHAGNLDFRPTTRCESIPQYRRDLSSGFLQLSAGWLHWSRRGELCANRSTAFSAGKLALALTIEASFISVAG
jgi:hypothetical protein